MNKKKIGWIILLITIIVLIFVVIGSSNKKEEQDNNIAENLIVTEHSKVEEKENKNEELKELTISNSSDGTLYSTTNQEIKADIIVGDNYYDTQIADISLNFSSYKGKTIEIEGMYLANGPYTFVGRYSTSNLCPDCPAGYSYFEYQLNGSNLPELEDEEDWIKVIGTLKEGYDEVLKIEYYYIDVISLEIMNERGLDTVSN